MTATDLLKIEIINELLTLVDSAKFKNTDLQEHCEKWLKEELRKADTRWRNRSNEHSIGFRNDD